MVKNNEYKELLFRIFLEKSSVDYGSYINKDTRDYSNYDDYKQIRALSPIYKENGNTMQFEIRNTWLRLEVMVKVNGITYTVYRNIFKLRNDKHRYYITNLWDISEQNMVNTVFKNTPFAKNELRKINLNHIME